MISFITCEPTTSVPDPAEKRPVPVVHFPAQQDFGYELPALPPRPGPRFEAKA